jgi:hypothetical protein
MPFPLFVSLYNLHFNIMCVLFSDGLNFQTENYLTIAEQLLQWTCLDDCKYQCMWLTTNAYIGRQWNVPQFYGKVKSV